MPQKDFSFQNFEVSTFWAPFFGVIFGLTKLLCGKGLISPDVSTTFPASFFTVIPKGLTTGPKSRTD